jgi:hypothetical protein
MTWRILKPQRLTAILGTRTLTPLLQTLTALLQILMIPLLIPMIPLLIWMMLPIPVKMLRVTLLLMLTNRIMENVFSNRQHDPQLLLLFNPRVT